MRHLRRRLSGNPNGPGLKPWVVMCRPVGPAVGGSPLAHDRFNGGPDMAVCTPALGRAGSLFFPRFRLIGANSGQFGIRAPIRDMHHFGTPTVWTPAPFRDTRRLRHFGTPFRDAISGHPPFAPIRDAISGHPPFAPFRAPIRDMHHFGTPTVCARWGRSAAGRFRLIEILCGTFGAGFPGTPKAQG